MKFKKNSFSFFEKHKKMKVVSLSNSRYKRLAKRGVAACKSHPPFFMKETFYFPHDHNAHQDSRMIELWSECGLQGVGFYWILVEHLHSEPTSKISEAQLRALFKMFQNSTNVEQVFSKTQQVLNSTGLLLKGEDGFYYSGRVLRNKKERAEISLKRSLAGKKSAEARQISTSVEQGKERKGKERKEKERKEEEEEGSSSEEPAPLRSDAGLEKKEVQHRNAGLEEKKGNQRGSKEISEMLLALRSRIGISAFVDSRIERNIGKHCVSLLKSLGKEEFVRRLDAIRNDSFKHKNCNSIRYVYSQIKGFIEPVSQKISITL